MPRQRSVARAPSRPTVSKPAPAPQQQRPATTYAPQHAAAPPAPAPVASQGPGLFGQMATTAAGVAVGSAMGHAITGLFMGSPSEPAPAAPVQAAAPPQAQYSNNNSTNNCSGAVESFTRCMDTHGGDMNICNWYLEQLKACQAAARQY
ncbi:Mitochondrial intermembrane space cysteine motif-containing protein MIC17 [Escovopsis weberi]|uniref:Mitochondrial intermembrane space cysteine motif-containing protein MIC17 n=1 Tax=Escovopsis weberi TaxID=150374 RepID=A0A0M8MZE1_ESCWE|nr:Mitochondrial intermembrane space cysteine motif-containing protein MIC17 [Escovopsis weberi]